MRHSLNRAQPLGLKFIQHLSQVSQDHYEGGVQEFLKGTIPFCHVKIKHPGATLTLYRLKILHKVELLNIQITKVDSYVTSLLECLAK